MRSVALAFVLFWLTLAAGGQKGDSPHLPIGPGGCFAQMGTVPFLSPAPAKPPAGRLIALPASYVELYQKIFQQQAKSGKLDLVRSAALSHVALDLWLCTHDPVYRQEAQRLFGRTLADPHFSLKDFHLLHHFGELALRLKEEHLLDPGQLQELRKLAAAELKNFCVSRDDGDYNIRVGQVAGYAGLFAFLKDEPFTERAAVKQRLDDYWNKIAVTGDLDEDASNYDSLGLAFLIDLARLLDRENDLARSPNFRRQFERFRDIVSPAGLIPEYGDAYFSYNGCPLDRIYLLEYAARLYDDPTFLYAARKLYGRPQAGLPDLDTWSRAMPLINMDLSRAQPRMPAGAPSLATYRARQGTAGPLADKLILRTGLEPGAAMVLMDLYASGSHAHMEKGPSIAYYEVGQVPLFHNLGRHGTRSAITGNLCWALPAAETFPGCWNRENAWHTMTIPCDVLTRHDDQFVLASAMSLRNFQERCRNCRYVFFDNLRLEGPAGVKLIDDFDRTAGWDPRLAKRTEVICSDDRTQGAHSQRVAWQAVPSAEFKRQFPAGKEVVFSRSQYDTLKLDLKCTGQRPYMHIRGLGRQIDLGDQVLVSELPEVRVEQRGRDAAARLCYASYIHADCTLTRRIVLTAEGYLVVHDVLTPGQSMDGWNGGTLWQLYDMADKGKDWFCADDDGAYPATAGQKGDSPHLCEAPSGPYGQMGTVPFLSPATVPLRRMLVRYAMPAGARAGVELIRQDCHVPNPKNRRADHFYTTFVQRKLTAGRPAGFNLAVLPHDPASGTPESVARRIGFQPGDEDSAQVTIAGAEGAPDVEIKIRGNDWSVVRRAR